MAKRLSAEQIVTKLRQIEVLQGQGKTIASHEVHTRFPRQFFNVHCVSPTSPKK